MTSYDVIIIGGGAAGITAGIYCVRRALKTLVIENMGIGGTMLWSEDIDNYPGFSQSTGKEISEKMEAHARKLGVEFLLDEVIGMELKGEVKKVKTRQDEYMCKAVIICTGTSPRKLGVPGEKEFSGKGVSYCATCVAPFFKNKVVAVVGGGSTAVEDATYMSKIASKVYIIHRRNQFRAEKVDVEKMEKADVEKILESTVKEIRGDQKVESIVITTPPGEKEMRVDGIFILVGTTPNSKLAVDAGVEVDEKGFIKVDNKQATNFPGVFAAGDVTGGIEQIVTAQGEACVAALSAYAYIEKPYWSK